MTDHNVSPAVTESEMNTFRDIFTRFADTVTNASQLSQDVANLRTQVEQITRDLQQAASTNAFLSDRLSQAQREKDEALVELSTTKATLATVEADRNMFKDQISRDSSTINRLQDEVNALKRERDDAHFRVLELEDKLKESDGRWGKLRELFGDGGQPTPKHEPAVDSNDPIYAPRSHF